MSEKPSNRPDWAKLFRDALNIPGRLSECYSVFHNFSLGNSLLAAIQLSERGLPLAPIASFKAWKEKFNRSVKKGEKAIALVMPVTVKAKTIELDQPQEGEGKEAGSFGRTIFVLKNNWFSLDQTDGEEFKPAVTIVQWDKAQALTQLAITEDHFEMTDGNCQGYAIPNEKRFAVNPVAAMPWKTTFHEIAHCLMHSKEAQMADGAGMPKDIKEAEAESVAYLCCATLELPGLEESRGYIQAWLGSKDHSDEFAKKSAARVFSTADKILKAGTTVSKEGAANHV